MGVDGPKRQDRFIRTADHVKGQEGGLHDEILCALDVFFAGQLNLDLVVAEFLDDRLFGFILVDAIADVAQDDVLHVRFCQPAC